MHSMTHDEAPRTPACTVFDGALTDYLAGRLPEHDAERLESHAMDCARCERVLDLGTQVPIADFNPPLPVAIRGAVLAEIGAPPRPASARTVVTRIADRRWPIAGGALIAASAAILLLRSSNGLEQRTEGTRVSIDAPAYAPSAIPPSAIPPSYEGNAAMESASQLASDRARTEFESLDAAAREIEGALQASPDDEQLRAYLSSVRARRGELMLRVREATS